MLGYPPIPPREPGGRPPDLLTPWFWLTNPPPPPPTTPKTVAHPSGSHIGWRQPPCLPYPACMHACLPACLRCAKSVLNEHWVYYMVPHQALCSPHPHSTVPPCRPACVQYVYLWVSAGMQAGRQACSQAGRQGPQGTASVLPCEFPSAMQNGMITTQPTPHNRLYFVPTSKILIPPSKLGKTRRRLACRLAGHQACRLGGRGGLDFTFTHIFPGAPFVQGSSSQDCPALSPAGVRRYLGPAS